MLVMYRPFAFANATSLLSLSDVCLSRPWGLTTPSMLPPMVTLRFPSPWLRHWHWPSHDPGLSRIDSSSPYSLISALLRLHTTSYRSTYKKMKSIERRSSSGRLRKMTVAVKALVEQQMRVVQRSNSNGGTKQSRSTWTSTDE